MDVDISENDEESTSINELKEVIEYLTTCGSTEFDKNKLKNLKKLCKESNKNVTIAFNEIFNQLHKLHSEIRLSSIFLINELFTRSHSFRELTIQNIETIFELTFKVKKPLPPPKAAARLLSEKSQQFFKEWGNVYGGTYVKLALALKFIPSTSAQSEGIQNRSQRQIQLHDQQIQGERLRKMKKEQFDNLYTEICNKSTEIRNCIDEIESCFCLLVPKFDEHKNMNNKPASDNDFRHLNQNYSVQVDINPQTMDQVVIEENEDNDIVIQNLKERLSTLQKKHKKNLQHCIERLTNLELAEHDGNINTVIKLLDLVDACILKSGDLKILSLQDSDDDDLEEVPEKEFHYIIQKQYTLNEDDKVLQNLDHCDSKQSLKKTRCKVNIKKISISTNNKDTNIWTPIRKEDNIADPASYSLALKKFNSSTKTVDNREGETSSAVIAELSNGSKIISTQSELHKMAPIVEYGHDLLEWDKESKKEMLESVTLGSAQALDIGARFWASSDNAGKSICDAAMSSLTSRSYAFVGEFERVKWSCRAPLLSGKVCSRMDRVKCPFHGKIIPRDVDGKPSNPEDVARLNKIEAEKEKNSVPDWQDPKLLEELKAKTGLDLKMPVKGRRGKKKKEKKYENLTDISKKTTSKIRLQNKVLSKTAMKRVSSVMDRMDAKKNFDKFGNNFNYALKE